MTAQHAPVPKKVPEHSKVPDRISICFWLSRAHVEQLADRAAHLEMSRSDLLRQAVRNYLAQPEQTDTEQSDTEGSHA